MNDKKVIVIFIAITALILSGGVFFLTQASGLSKVEVSQNAKVSVDQLKFDWGQIAYEGGNVTKTFIIKNSGTDVLKLSNIKTSCHCTQAQVAIDGVTSPYFGMNSVSSWVGEVDPGKEAQMTVVFDPKYHGPQGVGPIERLVAVETNDASNKRLEFSLTGTVVKDEKK